MTTTLQAGVAKVDITPAVGFDFISGFPRYAPAVGVVDEMMARALVLDDGQTPLAIVCADLLWFTEPLVAAIGQHVERLTGIPRQHIVLNASHAHTPPETYPPAGASESYLEELGKKVAGAIYMAWRRREPALLGHGLGHCAAGINRYRFPDGAPWTFQPAPDEPVDHSVSVLRVDRQGGEALAVVVNYACHPSILPGDFMEFCGDYTTPLMAAVGEAFGPDTLPMFLAGAGGDVKVAVLTEDGERFRAGTLDDCRRYGRMIGNEAARVARDVQCLPVDRLGYAQAEVELPTLPPRPADDYLRAAEQLRQKADRSGMDDRVLEWLEENACNVAAGTAPLSKRLIMQLLTISPEIVLLALPGELFVEIGMKLKAALGVPAPFLAAYSNDTLSVGYIPSARAVEHGWSDTDINLQVFQRPCLPANYSAEAEPRLLAAATELAVRQGLPTRRR